MRPTSLSNQFFLGALPPLLNLTLKISTETLFTKILGRAKPAQANLSISKIANALSKNINLQHHSLLPATDLTSIAFRRILKCTCRATPANESSDLLSQEAK